MKSIMISAALVSAAAMLAPPAAAMYYGNYDLNIPDHRDFHTWVWAALTPCDNPDGTHRAGARVLQPGRVWHGALSVRQRSTGPRIELVSRSVGISLRTTEFTKEPAEFICTFS